MPKLTQEPEKYELDSLQLLWFESQLLQDIKIVIALGQKYSKQVEKFNEMRKYLFFIFAVGDFISRSFKRKVEQ